MPSHTTQGLRLPKRERVRSERLSGRAIAFAARFFSANSDVVENGLHVTLALLAPSVPGLVETSVATDNLLLFRSG